MTFGSGYFRFAVMFSLQGRDEEGDRAVTDSNFEHFKCVEIRAVAEV